MNLLDSIHGGYVFKRRVRVLSDHLAALLPRGASVLDVGCGDGLIARLITEKRPDVRIQGIDILVRPKTHVPVRVFNGKFIPYLDATFDAVMFVDVLHHTEDPMVLLKEAQRVSKRCVLIKDHNRNGFLAQFTLRFMDWVGNARHGVVLPYNYWSMQQWQSAFTKLGLQPVENRIQIGLYPSSVNWLFGRSLHFITLLNKGMTSRDKNKHPRMHS